MEHGAKYKDHPVHEKMKLLAEALTTLKHARVFISTREKMHPTGIELYDDLIRRMEQGARFRAGDAGCGRAVIEPWRE
jgi:hypothetical protein